MQTRNQDRIFTQQVQQIYSQGINAIFAVTGVSLVTVFLIWSPQLSQPLLAWFSILLILSLIRLLLIRAYRQDLHQLTPAAIWARRYLLLELAMGLSWAGLGLLLYQSSEVDLVLMMLILGSMATGALPMLSVVFSIYVAFLFSLGIGTAFILVSKDDIYSQYLALFTLIYILVLWLAGRTNYQRNSQTLSLSLENLDLVDSLNQQMIQTREAEARYRTLSDATNEGVLLHEHGTIIDANHRATDILGYSLDELKAFSLADIFEGTNKQQVNALMAHGDSTDYEISGLRKDGTRLPLEVNKRHLSLQQRNIDVITLHDITTLKQITEIKDQFISTVSHELRTPLTSIHASLGLLMGGIGGKLSSKQEELISLAHSNSERLNTLINDLLDVQKLDEGKLAMKRENVDLMVLVQQAMDLNQAYVDKFDCNLRFNSPQTSAMVFVDRARLIQVFTNLISNAAKFSPVGSDIDISVSQDEHQISVSVHNHGTAIPEAFQKKIFQRFSQADTSDTRNHSGSGLGLYISQQIMHDMDGDIGFTTEPGKGTTFTISMPAITY